MKKWWKFVLGVVGFGAIIIVVLLLAPKSPVPQKIKKDLSFTLFLPDGGEAKVAAGSAKFDPAVKMLSYKVQYEGTEIVISQQSTPAEFVDIPAAYAKVVDGMNNYLSFDVNIGTVHVTKPQQFNGGQTAILNSKGTLLLAKPKAALSDAQWQKLFHNFVAEN